MVNRFGCACENCGQVSAVTAGMFHSDGTLRLSLDCGCHREFYLMPVIEFSGRPFNTHPTVKNMPSKDNEEEWVE